MNRQNRVKFNSVFVVAFALMMLLSFGLFMKPISASASTASTLSTSEAAQKLVGNNITIENVSFTGKASQLGYFTESEGMNLPFSEGIVLSTGNANSVFSYSNVSKDLSGSGYQRLTDLYRASGFTGSTNDAAVLQFSLTPNAPFLSFDYFFASTEYDQDARYNDIFALWVIDDMGTTTTADDEWFNIALLPNGNIVSIQTTVARTASGAMNHKSDGQYYHAVSGYRINGYPFGFLGYTDAFTADASTLRNSKNEPVIQVGKKISACFAIADSSDSVWDSAVFLRANSLNYSSDGQDVTKQLTIRTAKEGDISEILYVQPELLFDNIKNVTCQWYVSTDKEIFTPIAGANEFSYRIPVELTEGTYYYKCICVGEGKTVESNICTIIILSKNSDADICKVTFVPCAKYTDMANFPSTLTVVSGQALPAYNTPEHSVYSFAGWYLDPEYKNSFDPKTPITSDLVLYAKWNEVLTDLAITKLPNKTVYSVGETISLSGIELIATFKSGVTVDVTEEVLASYEGIYISEAKDFSVPISYEYDGIVMNENYSVHVHQYEKNETKKATCTEQGEYTYICVKGDHTYTEIIPKLGHGLVHHDAKSPTCTEVGWKAYDSCSRCDYTTYEEIPALGHTAAQAVEENRVEATCVADGHYDEVVYCSVCENELSRVNKTIAKVEHTEVEVPAVAATCTETGLTAGTKCSVCGKIFVAQQIVPALGHNAGDWIVDKDSTCTAVGSKHKECLTCGTITVTIEIEMKEHTHTQAVVENRVEATCTVDGSYDEVVYCSVCNNEVSRVKITIAKVEHTEVEVIAVAATCTETGLTAGTKCSVCGEILVVQQTVPALGHNSGDWIVDKDSTCTAVGSKHKECLTCGATTETIEIEKKEHTHTTSVEENRVEATCTVDGHYDEVFYCIVCENEIRVTHTITKLGHSWNNGEITLEPTYTENGLKTYTCDVCGETKTEEFTKEDLCEAFKKQVEALSADNSREEQFDVIKGALVMYKLMDEAQKAEVSTSYSKLQTAIEEYNQKAQTNNEQYLEAAENGLSIFAALGGLSAIISALWFVLKRKIY